MRRIITFDQLLFSDGEHPTSFKLNQILNLIEYIRLANGPYNVSLYSQDSDTEFTVELLEDPTLIGGLDASTLQTNRSFNVFYETNESLTEHYGRWNDVYFTVTGGRLLATLTSGDNVY
ncbi:MAG: hypothetical protein DRI86_16170, partial [Bacteroidetes bacterium]